MRNWLKENFEINFSFSSFPETRKNEKLIGNKENNELLLMLFHIFYVQ